MVVPSGKLAVYSGLPAPASWKAPAERYRPENDSAPAPERIRRPADARNFPVRPTVSGLA